MPGPGGVHHCGGQGTDRLQAERPPFSPNRRRISLGDHDRPRGSLSLGEHPQEEGHLGGELPRIHQRRRLGGPWRDEEPDLVGQRHDPLHFILQVVRFGHLGSRSPELGDAGKGRRAGIQLVDHFPEKGAPEPPGREGRRSLSGALRPLRIDVRPTLDGRHAIPPLRVLQFVPSRPILEGTPRVPSWPGTFPPPAEMATVVLVVIGFIVVFGSVAAGYVMHGGNLLVLWQVSEFVIIGGAGLGAVFVAEKPRVVRRMVGDSLALMRASPYTPQVYAELLQVLYDLFLVARKEGLTGVEPHVEDPGSSEILQRYPSFASNEHAVSFLCDTLKVLLTGAVEDHHLSEILELDLERHHDEADSVPDAMQTVADAMPAFGIVAAVLGVIITMGYIGGAPEIVGKSVAAALVGTFLGILLGYGLFGPLARALRRRVHEEEQYMACIRLAILSFARGDAPITSVEFARRGLEPEFRPSFEELESMTRRRGSSGSTTPIREAA